VRSASVSLDSLFVAIEFKKYEPARIVDLLDDIKSNHAWLLSTVSGVGLRFRYELIQTLSLNIKMHQNRNHQSPLSRSALVATKSTAVASEIPPDYRLVQQKPIDLNV
jgi:hypothetical protein